MSLQQPATLSKSESLLNRARRSLAGGDSSTMRVLPYHLPLVAARGEGSRLWDVDGNEFIDLNMAYGPLLLGHCPREIIEAVTRQIGTAGSQLGFPTEVTIRVAEKIKRLVPSMELMRFANSGTEAVASAIRLARAYTGRQKIILFEGHYHGWSDTVFHKYHAPITELPDVGFGPALPGTAGMNGSPRDAIVVRWNDIDLLERVLEQHSDEIAAVIMEPIQGNAGVILPESEFLTAVRAATLEHDCLLIFDEVITGFRVDAGGAQKLYMVTPDLTVVSKAFGGGYPVGAFGGAAQIMELIVDGTVFHGGVFSGNAIVMSAAEAVLDRIIAQEQSLYSHLYNVADQLADGLHEIMTRLGVPHLVQHVGPLLSLFLMKDEVEPIKNYRDVRRLCDIERYIDFQHALQQRGVYFHPNQFEPMFLSAAHTKDDIDLVLERVEDGARCSLLR